MDYNIAQQLNFSLHHYKPRTNRERERREIEREREKNTYSYT